MDEHCMKKISQLVDKTEIQELAYRYAEILDTTGFNAENAGEVFTADAQLTYPNKMTAKGIEEIVVLTEKMDGLFSSMCHDVTNMLVSFNGDKKANVSFHFAVMHKLIPPIAEKAGVDLFIVNDLVKCKAEKDENGWRFTEVVLETLFSQLGTSVDGPPIPKP